MLRPFSLFPLVMVWVWLPLFAALCAAHPVRRTRLSVAQPLALLVPNIRPGPVRSITPFGAFC